MFIRLFPVIPNRLTGAFSAILIESEDSRDGTTVLLEQLYG